jgi:hypothetical protein
MPAYPYMYICSYFFALKGNEQIGNNVVRQAMSCRPILLQCCCSCDAKEFRIGYKFGWDEENKIGFQVLTAVVMRNSTFYAFSLAKVSTAACFMLVSSLAYCSTLKMEETCSSETLVACQRTFISPKTGLFRTRQAYVYNFDTETSRTIETEVSDTENGY